MKHLAHSPLLSLVAPEYAQRAPRSHSIPSKVKLGHHLKGVEADLIPKFRKNPSREIGACTDGLAQSTDPGHQTSVDSQVMPNSQATFEHPLDEQAFGRSLVSEHTRERAPRSHSIPCKLGHHLKDAQAELIPTVRKSPSRENSVRTESVPALFSRMLATDGQVQSPEPENQTSVDSRLMLTSQSTPEQQLDDKIHPISELSAWQASSPSQQCIGHDKNISKEELHNIRRKKNAVLGATCGHLGRSASAGCLFRLVPPDRPQEPKFTSGGVQVPSFSTLRASSTALKRGLPPLVNRSTATALQLDAAKPSGPDGSLPELEVQGKGQGSRAESTTVSERAVLSDKYAKCITLQTALEANGWSLHNGLDSRPGGWTLKWGSVAEIHYQEFEFGAKQVNSNKRAMKNQQPRTTLLLNHFCKDRCKGLSNKRMLLRNLRAAHVPVSLSQWLPRSYDLTDPNERKLLTTDFAKTAAEALAVRAADRECVDRDALELAIKVLQGRKLDMQMAAVELTRHLSREAGAAGGETAVEEPLRATAEQAILRQRENPLRQHKISSWRNLWFVKKADADRGEGIAVDWRLPELLRIAESWNWGAVVQKYMEKPLAPEGRKMDLRVWMLILRWKPMQAWLWSEPYARLASKSFNFDQKEITDPLVHLTNRCQQVRGEGDGDGAEHGRAPRSDDEPHCWTLQRLRSWLSGAGGFQEDVWDTQVWPRLVSLARHVLRALEDIPGSKPCKGVRSFEVVGLDMMLDEQLAPWLLEANCSPDLCGDAGPALRESVSRSLCGAMALVKRNRNERDWLPPAAEVVASGSGLVIPEVDGWRLIMD